MALYGFVAAAFDGFASAAFAIVDNFVAVFVLPLMVLQKAAFAVLADFAAEFTGFDYFVAVSNCVDDFTAGFDEHR
eukprot:9766722-Ditylum_brightwellii.AAC.1